MKQVWAFVALLLLAAVGPAAAQSTPQPQQEAERKAAPSGSGLNLKLDDADLRSLSRSTSVPREDSREQSADGLPSLGGDARKFEPPTPSSDRRRPYPGDSERMISQ